VRGGRSNSLGEAETTATRTFQSPDLGLALVELTPHDRGFSLAASSSFHRRTSRSCSFSAQWSCSMATSFPWRTTIVLSIWLAIRLGKALAGPSPVRAITGTGGWEP